LRNLISNAVTFSPPNGTIDLAAWREDSWAVISVSDSGPGIPEGAFAAIFERFYSERPKTEKFGTHSGLGLSISKQIVEAHGGSIRAENRHDGGGGVIGARLVIRLPLD
jgi:two-component system sensor histidine kinase ChvG